MADDWFKLNMDIFSNRKIKYLRRLPRGDSIALFWIALLSEARRCNSDGKIFLTESIPYTPGMLAEEFNFDEKTVEAALDAFEQLDMISSSGGFITIAGWEDHQNAEGLAKIREQTRKRVAKHREKQNALQCNATVTQCNATDIEEEKDLELDIKKENIRGGNPLPPPKEKVDCQQIVDLYHEICKSFPSVRSLSDARRKAIKARLNTYSVEDFKTVFENAEASSFLKGSNDRNWTATFDWLIKDQNMAKVLEGNYADKGTRNGGGRKEAVPKWMKNGVTDWEKNAIQRMMGETKLKTAADDPALAERVERMKERLQGG